MRDLDELNAALKEFPPASDEDWAFVAEQAGAGGYDLQIPGEPKTRVRGTSKFQELAGARETWPGIELVPRSGREGLPPEMEPSQGQLSLTESLVPGEVTPGPQPPEPLPGLEEGWTQATLQEPEPPPRVFSSALLMDEAYQALPPAEQYKVLDAYRASGELIYDTPVDGYDRVGWWRTFGEAGIRSAFRSAAEMVAGPGLMEAVIHLPEGKLPTEEEVASLETMLGGGIPGPYEIERLLPDVDGERVKVRLSRDRLAAAPTLNNLAAIPASRVLAFILDATDYEVTDQVTVGEALEQQAMQEQRALQMHGPDSAVMAGEWAGWLGTWGVPYGRVYNFLTPTAWLATHTGLLAKMAAQGFAMGGAAAAVDLYRVGTGARDLEDVGTSAALGTVVGALGPAAGRLWQLFQSTVISPSVGKFIDMLAGKTERAWATEMLHKDEGLLATPVGQHLATSLQIGSDSIPSSGVPTRLKFGEWLSRYTDPTKPWAAKIQSRYPRIRIFDAVQRVDDAVFNVRRYWTDNSERVTRYIDSIVKRVPSYATVRGTGLRKVYDPVSGKELGTLSAEAAPTGDAAVRKLLYEALTGAPRDPTRPYGVGGARSQATSVPTVPPTIGYRETPASETVSAYSRRAVDQLEGLAKVLINQWRVPKSIQARYGGGPQLRESEINTYLRNWLPRLRRLPVAAHGRHLSPKTAKERGLISQAEFLDVEGWMQPGLGRVKAFHADLLRAGWHPSKTTDVQQFMFQVMRASAERRYMAEPLRAMLKEFTQRRWKGTDPGYGPDREGKLFYPTTVRITAQQFYNEVTRAADPLKRDMQEGFKAFLERLGINPETTASNDFVDVYIAATYGSLMGWRPGSAIRQLFQIPTVVYPRLGARFTGEGIRRAAAGAKDPRGPWVSMREELRTIGVTLDDYLPYMEQSLARTLETSPEAGPVGRALVKTTERFIRGTEIGMTGVRIGDAIGRAVAYYGQDARMTWAFDRLKGRMTEAGLEPGRAMPSPSMIASYFREAGLRSFSPAEQRGVLRQMFIQPGAVVGKEADIRRLMSFRFQEDTNWVYRAGHRPRLFSGTVGKAFGQFGVWPLNYQHFLRHMARTALTESPSEGAAQWTRWVVANSAISVVGQDMLGIDTGHWIWFSPLAYEGGPIFNDLMTVLNSQLLAPVTGAREGPEADIYRGRLWDIPMHLVPGYGGARDFANALNEAGVELSLTDPELTLDLIQHMDKSRFVARYFFPLKEAEEGEIDTERLRMELTRELIKAKHLTARSVEVR